jgi:hypothetical protein
MTTQIVPTQVRPEVPHVGYNCSQSRSLPYQDLTDAYMEIKSDVRALKMEFKWVGTETQNGADARRLDPPPPSCALTGLGPNLPHGASCATPFPIAPLTPSLAARRLAASSTAELEPPRDRTALRAMERISMRLINAQRNMEDLTLSRTYQVPNPNPNPNPEPYLPGTYPV